MSIIVIPNIILLKGDPDFSFSVSVKGGDKTNYISDLRATLNDIFDSYKRKQPELQYRIERFGEIPDELEEMDPLWELDRNIFNYYKRNKPYYDVATDQHIPIQPIINIYKIEAENVMSGGQGNKIIKSTFNFRDCNIDLQGNLNKLAQLLPKEAKEEAEELKGAANALKEVKDCKNEEEVKEAGKANRLKRLLGDFNNKESKLHKTVKDIKHGIGIAQDIAKGYNEIAQWAGLPQVPTPF